MLSAGPKLRIIFNFKFHKESQNNHCAYVLMCMCARVHVCACACVRMCMSAHVHVCACACVRMCMCAHVYECMIVFQDLPFLKKYELTYLI